MLTNIKTNQDTNAETTIAVGSMEHSSLLPSWVTTTPSTPIYDSVISTMSKNRKAAWMIDDLWPEMVIVPDDVKTVTAGTAHKVQASDIGKIDTIIFPKHNGSFEFIEFEPTKIVSDFRVEIDILDMGVVVRSNGNAWEDEYFKNRYLPSIGARIILDSAHPMSAELNTVYNWYTDEEQHLVTDLFLLFQNWVFS